MENIKSRDQIYKGIIINKKFKFDEIDIKWITNTDNRHSKSRPFILFEYDYKLYYGIGDYEFSTFETYYEWTYDDDKLIFDHLDPKEEDYNYLLFKSNFIFYKFDHEEKIVDDDSDSLCDFELNIINEYYKRFRRDSLIKSLNEKPSKI